MGARVAIISNTSWNIFNFRLNLARALRTYGYEVILIAPRDEYSERLSREFEYHDIYMSNKGTNPIEDLKTTIGFYKLFNQLKPSVILSYTIKPNIYGNIAGKLSNVKSINNISGLGTAFIQESLITKVVKQLYKYSLSKSSRVFFQNGDDKELFIDKRLVKDDSCDLVPGSGVDSQKFQPSILEHSGNSIKFLLIARMLWDKGVGEFIESARIIKEKYPNASFYLLGAIGVENSTAIQREQIEAWEAEGIIKYLGISDNVKEVIDKADCIVLPSYREGVPRSLLEAASMAKPIITTNVVGCKEVVDDGINGFLCEAKNAKDLARQIEKMILLSSYEREEMGWAGRAKIINEFDEKIVIDKYITAIKEIA